MLRHGICTSINEIKNNLTIDQVYLFYEQCMRDEIESQKINAITLANSLIYASPSNSRPDMTKKQRSWDAFMRALTWDKITKPKENPDPQALAAVFGSLGVPSTNVIKLPKKEEVKK